MRMTSGGDMRLWCPAGWVSYPLKASPVCALHSLGRRIGLREIAQFISLPVTTGISGRHIDILRAMDDCRRSSNSFPIVFPGASDGLERVLDVR